MNIIIFFKIFNQAPINQNSAELAPSPVLFDPAKNPHNPTPHTCETYLAQFRRS